MHYSEHDYYEIASIVKLGSIKSTHDSNDLMFVRNIPRDIICCDD